MKAIRGRPGGPAMRLLLSLAAPAALWTGCAEPPSPGVTSLGARASSGQIAHPDRVTINPSEGEMVVHTGDLDALGEPVTLGCATCHTLRRPIPTTATSPPREVHEGLVVEHGDLRCQACHAPPDYAELHLADGRRVGRDAQIALCSQCHGTQRRDYDHGAHGGMSGYWDLEQGERTRNTCTDCHDAHAPAYRPVWPAPGPRDRFLAATPRLNPEEADHGR